MSHSGESFMNPFRFIGTIALAITTALLAPAAAAQSSAWPSRPIHLIVPGGPGSVSDAQARWLAAHLEPLLGQPIVVDNRPGAGGNVGTQLGAQSTPDGYTLTIVHQGTMVFNPHLYAHPGYQPLVDFAPITYLGVNPLLLAVPTSVPVTSVAELVRLAKEKPGQLNFGSPGIGTPPHMAAELFKRAAAIDVQHIPYKGGGESMNALLGGQVTFSIEGTAAQLPQALAGRLRPLAVTGPVRLAALPNVPTMAEAGFPAAEYMAWTGIAAPSKTPRPVIDRLQAGIAKILATDEAKEWFRNSGAEPNAISPEAFTATIRADDVKWGKVIRDAGIRVE
jgi:tripartite-type tricarboxylate transporter receptor subunit TctC